MLKNGGIDDGVCRYLQSFSLLRTWVYQVHGMDLSEYAKLTGHPLADLRQASKRFYGGIGNQRYRSRIVLKLIGMQKNSIDSGGLRSMGIASLHPPYRFRS
jgi:hypothetical protein